MGFAWTSLAVVLVAMPVLSAAAAGAEAAGIDLPSGRVVSFQDVIWGEPGPSGLTVRFRFLDPGLAAEKNNLDFFGAEDDMRYLCETYALERIASTGPQPAQIVISIADRPVAFGDLDTEATQLFEAYSRDGAACVWEGF